MAVDTTTVPELTTEQVQRILVQPLETESLFLASGPRIFDSANQIRIPKMGAGTDPAWHGENEQITEAEADVDFDFDFDFDFDEIVLLPSTMKSVKVLTRFSNEQARQSVIALEAALKTRRRGRQALRAVSSAPPGTAPRPRGMFAWTGTQSVAVDGALTLDHLLDAWGKALAANVNMTRLRWIMTPREFTALQKVKDLQDRYQLQPDPTQDGVFRRFGAPVTVTSRAL